MIWTCPVPRKQTSELADVGGCPSFDDCTPVLRLTWANFSSGKSAATGRPVPARGGSTTFHRATAGHWDDGAPAPHEAGKWRSLNSGSRNWIVFHQLWRYKWIGDELLGAGN